MQVKIDGLEHADQDQKYIYIEDQHAIGDQDLLLNEAVKGENKSYICTVVVMFLVLAGSAIICCYLNYKFTKILAIKVFYMFAGAFFGDMLICRMLIIFFLAMLRLCVGCFKGYRKIPYKSSKDINNLLKNGIKEMFSPKKTYQGLGQDTPGFSTENNGPTMSKKE